MFGREHFHVEHSRAATDPLPPWFVTGFAESSGSFTFSRSDRNIGVYFALRLGDADRSMLELIQRYFGGVGKIYDQKVTSAPRSRHAAVYYRVTRCRDLLEVVDHFDRYPLQGNKRESYQVWREMVELKNRFYRRPPGAELELLARRLSELSPRNQLGR